MTRLVDTVLKQFPVKIPVTYWLDSTATLCWIKNDRDWKQYVSRRINEIRSLSAGSQWRYCPETVNPADFPSHGLDARKLVNCTAWWEGPPFLKLNNDQWPTLRDPPFDEVVYSELSRISCPQTHVISTVVDPAPVNLDHIMNCQDFSNLNHLLRVTAQVLRFVELVSGKALSVFSVDSHGGLLEATELNRAEIMWMRSIQHQSFSMELKYLINQ